MNAPNPFPQRNQLPFFTPKQLSTQLSLCGRLIDIHVQTPDLTSVPTRVWGDWGPMYTCSLTLEQVVQLRYRCQADGLEASYTISPPTIAINSPMFIWERETHPLRLELVDLARGIELHAYMDPEGAVAQVKTRLLRAPYDVDSLIFREVQLAARSEVA